MDDSSDLDILRLSICHLPANVPDLYFSIPDRSQHLYPTTHSPQVDHSPATLLLLSLMLPGPSMAATMLSTITTPVQMTTDNSSNIHENSMTQALGVLTISINPIAIPIFSSTVSQPETERTLEVRLWSTETRCRIILSRWVATNTTVTTTLTRIYGTRWTKSAFGLSRTMISKSPVRESPVDTASFGHLRLFHPCSNLVRTTWRSEAFTCIITLPRRGTYNPHSTDLPRGSLFSSFFQTHTPSPLRLRIYT